jgi:hypothetical protein
VRPAAGWAALVTAQVALALQYVWRGLAWHWLLHSLLGLGAGLVAAALLRRPRPLPWAVAGQALSVLPDLLFLPLSLPHQRWMDALVAHITVHLAPTPVPVALAVFVLGGWAWWLCVPVGHRLAGTLLAGAGTGLLAVALLSADPVPTRLADYPLPSGCPW